MALIRRTRLRRARRVLRLMVAFYAATLAFVLACNLLWPRTSEPETVEWVICLGGGASQGVLSEASLMRAERCGQLVLDGRARSVLVTGHGAGILMVGHLRGMGLTDAQILLEPDSRSTLQNALYSAALVDPQDPAILVTDAYHLPRSWVSYRVMGFRDIQLVSSTGMVDRPAPLLREASAIWFNALRVLIYAGTFWADPEMRAALLA